MKRTKRIVSLVIAMLMLATSVCTASASGIPAVIGDYFECLDQQNWTALGSLLAEEDHAEFEAFIANADNQNNHIGYFNFESVGIVSCQEVAEDEMDTSYLSEDKLNNYSDLECWDCIVYVDAHEDTDYLVSGYNHYIIFVGEDAEGNSRIVQVLRDKIYIHTEESVSTRGIDTPVTITYGNEWANPQTIKVLYNGSVLTLNFKEYCYVVLMNEFGTNSFNEEARKASGMCVKQYAWNRILVQKYPNLGYDVVATNGDQVYNPNNTPTTKVIAAIDAIWDYMMLTSDNKLFCSFYCTSSSTNPDAVMSGGALSHTEANYLGNIGYDWQEILHYYYDNATREGINYGIIKIIPFDHSLIGMTRQSSGSVHHHYVKCTTCGSYHKESHTWRYSNGLYTCMICKFQTSIMIG